MANTEDNLNQGADRPSHFVVEIETDDGVHYVICEALVRAEAGSESLPSSVLAEFLERNPLRAAAIPGESSGAPRPTWLAAAMVGQSGRGP